MDNHEQRVNMHNRLVQLAWHGEKLKKEDYPDVSDCHVCKDCGVIHEYGW